jgi:hypothetical protein
VDTVAPDHSWAQPRRGGGSRGKTGAGCSFDAHGDAEEGDEQTTRQDGKDQGHAQQRTGLEARECVRAR